MEVEAEAIAMPRRATVRSEEEAWEEQPCWYPGLDSQGPES